MTEGLTSWRNKLVKFSAIGLERGISQPLSQTSLRSVCQLSLKGEPRIIEGSLRLRLLLTEQGTSSVIQKRDAAHPYHNLFEEQISSDKVGFHRRRRFHLCGAQISSIHRMDFIAAGKSPFPQKEAGRLTPAPLAFILNLLNKDLSGNRGGYTCVYIDGLLPRRS